jgi:hypothetical protein
MEALYFIGGFFFASYVAYFIGKRVYNSQMRKFVKYLEYYGGNTGSYITKKFMEEHPEIFKK